MITPIYKIQFCYLLYKNYEIMKKNKEYLPKKNLSYNFQIYNLWYNLKYENYEFNNYKEYYIFTKKYLINITKNYMKKDKFMKKDNFYDYDYYLSLVFDSFIYYLKKSILNLYNEIKNDENYYYNENDLHFDSILDLKYNIISKNKKYCQYLYKWECDELWKDYCLCNPIDRKISYEDIKSIVYDVYNM